MILAPLRGVTIDCFRRVFAREIAAAGFTEAVMPFTAANPGTDPMKDREFRASAASAGSMPFRVVPQFIGKDPAALGFSLRRSLEAGFGEADLNAGCPYPMIRNKGRGSGLLRSPETLRRLLGTGCEAMGDGKFSLKTRLGVADRGEIYPLLPMISEFPLRHLTVHARTARQMYDGEVESAAFARIAAAVPFGLVRNGDLPVDAGRADMVGRAFIRSLGDRDDIGELLDRYIDESAAELCGERPVLGRIKELVAYWKDRPRWRRVWDLVKVSASLAELRRATGLVKGGREI